MLSGRFICSECGRSEGAQEMPVKESYRSVSKELERHTVSGAFRGKYEPDDLLRIYARDFGEESVEAVLLRYEDLLTEEYFTKISTHPSIPALKEALPKCRIPRNINAYCNKVRQLLKAEEELVDAQEDLKNADKYVKGLIEKEKRKPKIKEALVTNNTVVVLLIIPLLLFIPAFFGGKHGEKPFVRSKNDLKAFFIVIVIIYAAIFLGLGIFKINSLIRNRHKKVGGDLVDIKKSIVDGIFARIYKLQEEKEQILKEIQDEENSILEKYGRKNNRSRR